MSPYSLTTHASRDTAQFPLRDCGRLIASISKPAPARAPPYAYNWIFAKQKQNICCHWAGGEGAGAGATRINKSKCQLKSLLTRMRPNSDWLVAYSACLPTMPAFLLCLPIFSACLSCPVSLCEWLFRLLVPSSRLFSLSGVLIFHPHRAYWLMLHLWPLNVKMEVVDPLGFVFVASHVTLIAP